VKEGGDLLEFANDCLLLFRRNGVIQN